MWGYDETEYFWEAITKLDYFWELFLNILGLFLKVKIQNWNNFGELLTFNYFWRYAVYF